MCRHIKTGNQANVSRLDEHDSAVDIELSRRHLRCHLPEETQRTNQSSRGKGLTPKKLPFFLSRSLFSVSRHGLRLFFLGKKESNSGENPLPTICSSNHARSSLHLRYGEQSTWEWKRRRKVGALQFGRALCAKRRSCTLVFVQHVVVVS